MTAPLTLYQLPPSPNNLKVRLVLGYKQLEFESRPLTITEFPGDRSEILAVSCQPRTPVLQHGDSVIFDSGAICRYLEANFPDSPRIFTEDYMEFAELERWELWSRTDLGPPVRTVFGQALREGGPDAAQLAEANRLMRAATDRIEGRLTEHDFLVGDHLTIADVSAVPGVRLTMLREDEAPEGTIHRFFRDHLPLGDDRDRTRAWVERVMAFEAR